MLVVSLPENAKSSDFIAAPDVGDQVVTIPVRAAAVKVPGLLIRCSVKVAGLPLLGRFFWVLICDGL